jgi:hypothetical protein
VVRDADMPGSSDTVFCRCCWSVLQDISALGSPPTSHRTAKPVVKANAAVVMSSPTVISCSDITLFEGNSFERVQYLHLLRVSCFNERMAFGRHR